MLMLCPLTIPTTAAIYKPYNLFNQSYGAYIIPLVINSLGGGHTPKHTHTCIQMFMDRSNSKKPGVHRPKERKQDKNHALASNG